MGTGKLYCPIGCPKESVVGYCHYHNATLSEHQLKKKKCLEKQCNRLQRIQHPFWERREETKRLRLERKQRLKQIGGE